MAVRGVVIAEAGRLGTPPLMAIGDATGGLPVRLRDGDRVPARGTLVEATGVIAAPYGQTELRLRAPLVVVGTGSLPEATAIDLAAADETTEGRLVRTSGMISTAPAKATSGDMVLAITGSGGATLRVYADASAGIPATSLRTGASVALTGIVGQRASRKGALDGYRLWLRDPSDVTIIAAPSPTPGTTATQAPPAARTPHMSIAAAKVRDGNTVTIEGTVTTGGTLLDASGRRAIIEDATGALELYLERPSPTIRPGARIRATGEVGRAWGAPRLRVTAVNVIGSRAPVVNTLGVAPGAATEWRLVRVRGTVTDVRKDGDRWTAELAQGGRRLLIAGLAGSGIPSTALVEGRAATITGIVKRPYPTATDRRYAIVPRSPGDVVLGAARPSPAGTANPGGSSTGASAGTTTGGEHGSPASRPDEPSGGVDGAGSVPRDVELVDLDVNLGATVRVGGLVTAVDTGGFELDDGTATVRVLLEGDAADLAGIIALGDAVNATGTPDRRDGLVLVVTDPAGLVLLGDLGARAATSPAGGSAGALAGTSIGPGTPGMDRIDAALAATGRPGPALLAGATVGLTAALGLVLAVWLRYRSVLRTRRRIALRLARLGGATDGRSGGPVGS